MSIGWRLNNKKCFNKLSGIANLRVVNSMNILSKSVSHFALSPSGSVYRKSVIGQMCSVVLKARRIKLEIFLGGIYTGLTCEAICTFSSFTHRQSRNLLSANKPSIKSCVKADSTSYLERIRDLK